VVLMPAALVTLLALLVWPAVAVLPAALVAVFLHFGVWLVRLFGSLALGDFRIPAPLLGQSLAFCGLLAAAILLARGGRWARRTAWAALLLAALAAVAPRPVDHPRDALLVEAIDVGQGDSLLLIAPDGETLLVDGGGFGGGPRQASQEFDIGEEVVSQALWSRGIRRLDLVALSHAHSDHMGGMPAILRNFRPRELWVAVDPDSDPYHALLAEAATLGIRVRHLRAGDTLAWDSIDLSVLAPTPAYANPGPPINNDSLVLRLQFGRSSALLEGDAEAPSEHQMVAASLINPAARLGPDTLLKVGHHGSRTSTTLEFLALVAPQDAVISVGLRNTFGHPRPEIIQRLADAHTRLFRTDQFGLTTFLLSRDGHISALTAASNP